MIGKLPSMPRTIATGVGVLLAGFLVPFVMNLLPIPSSQGFGVDDIVAALLAGIVIILTQRMLKLK